MKLAMVMRRSTFGALLLAHTVNHVYLNVMPVLFPSIKDELVLSYGQIGILATSFTFAMGFGQFFVGFVCTYFSRRIVLIAGLAVSAVMILLSGLASGFYALLLWQLLAGFGASTYHPAGTATVSGLSGRGSMGRIMGIHDTAGSIGTIVAPLAAASAIIILGWRSTLVAFAVPGLLIAALLFLVTRSGLSQIGKADYESSKSIRKEFLFLLRDSRFMALVVVNSLITFRFRGLMAFLPSYLVKGVAIDLSLVGLYLSVMFVGFLFGPYCFGYFRDKFGGRPTLLALAILPSVGLCALVIPTGISMLVIELILLGFVVYSSGPVVTAVAADLGESRATDIVYGFLFATGFSISATASIVTGFMIDNWGFAAGFYLLALISVAASPLIVLLPRHC